MKIEAPWTDEEVATLNRWQKDDEVHPFTCPRDHERPVNLVATPDGWRCPECSYTQTWAHDFMIKAYER